MAAPRTLKVYKAKDGYRWHLWYNGKILADSGEAYTRRGDAEKAARRVFSGVDYPIILVIERYISSKLVWRREHLQ